MMTAAATTMASSQHCYYAQSRARSYEEKEKEGERGENAFLPRFYSGSQKIGLETTTTVAGLTTTRTIQSWLQRTLLSSVDRPTEPCSARIKN